MDQSIARPIVTEKTFQSIQKGWYSFATGIKATKKTIASSVHALYNVDVIEVRTITMHGKSRRVGKKQAHVLRPDWKKALIKVKKGQKIDVFEAGATQPEVTSEK